jgi:hypothetical protein
MKSAYLTSARRDVLGLAIARQAFMNNVERVE